jgi:hypothetical protein
VCDLCDGLTDGALMARTFERITTNRFTMFSVDGPAPWAYTVGLVESYDHPELVVTGLNVESSSVLLSGIAERVKTGERFDDPNAVAYVRGASVRFGEVHPAQWLHGRFNMWFGYYDWRGLRLDPMAIQIHWPLEWVCPADRRRHREPLLDHDPGHDVNANNRAERRRSERRQR